MFKQMQRSAPPPVKQLHVFGLHIERSLSCQMLQQRLQLCEPRCRQRGLDSQSLLHFRQMGTQLGIGVAQ